EPEKPKARTASKDPDPERPRGAPSPPLSPSNDTVWQSKCMLLEDEKVDLQNQVSDLNQQVQILVEKLQEVGGDQAVREVEEKIKLTPVRRRKKKKLQAYQRLYEDAQRRIINMRVKAKVLEKDQEEQIGTWRKSV
ncbi:unnamed protein product, partial [Effrenium voratum]